MHKKVSLENLNDLVEKPTGLDERELTQQRLKFGPNDIIERVGNPWLELLVDTIKDPMVWFLVGIAVIFYLIGDYREAIILFSATIPLIFMDTFLHWRTQASTASLRSQLSSKVLVMRQGVQTEVDSFEIVPGDLVVLTTENHFLPADGLWEDTDSLQIDESVLTGEAFPVTKSSIQFNPFKNTGELLLNTNVLGFAGTRVLTGKGHLRVLYTGKNTSYGEIVQSVVRATQEKTPLQIAILELTRFMIYASIVFCLALFAIRYYQGHGWLDALLSAAVLAVAAIPEEFPVVFTFFLGVGIYRLAKHNALVRRAVSVENIGRVTQICTDKTGTLTLGQLTLTHIDTALGADESKVLTIALAASNVEGTDPLDQALFHEANIKKIEIPKRFSVIPFTEDRKRETGFIKHHNSVICTIKGSPEIVLSKSNLSQEELSQWNTRVNEWAKCGHKVIGVASIEVPEVSVNGYTEPTTGFQFSGLLVFEDPPRPEIKDAIKFCHKNAIKVLMITGDHPETAAAIAKDIELVENSPVVISAEQEAYKLEDEWLKQHPDFLKNIDVIARCNPLQKLQIVEALKNSSELVAVTGDGVNDVPALKAADIGVAMGLRGTRSAKEVSSIILADDNFSTIVNAIREGKQLFENLRMSFKYLLLIHIPFVLTAAIIPLMGYPLLYLPIHVVLMELIIHPTALFAFQQYATETNDRNLSHQKTFFSKRDVIFILAIGLSLTAILIFSYVNGVSENHDVEHGRAMVMALLSIWSAAIVIVLTKGKTLTSKLIIIVTLVATVILIQNTWLAKTLHFAPLHILDWGKVFAIALVFLIILFLSHRTKKLSN